ncbi:hypothetical protein LJB88_02265 [Erysipelotrichaceae bacterium OttesenSCG-928-M19]|nr:hypothetical protein [Erysipelotrichaceae bacterium OttesenSCG-928-M19]
MSAYEEGYARGYQMAMALDVIIWMIVGFIFIKFVVGRFYKNSTGKDLENKWIIIGVVIIGLVEAALVYL